MNDFTEKELEIINYALYYLSMPLCGNVKQIEDLLKKVNNMVESYCEHEWENTCCGCSSITCIKCQNSIETVN